MTRLLTFHAAIEPLIQLLGHNLRVLPLAHCSGYTGCWCGDGLALLLRTDQRLALDTCNITWVGPGQVAEGGAVLNVAYYYLVVKISIIFMSHVFL